MTEDINLQKGNQFWYEFREELYENSNNTLLDRSTNRYHLTAKGAPTINGNSPIGGSAVCDGNDDHFYRGGVDNEVFDSEATFAYVLKTEESDTEPFPDTVRFGPVADEIRLADTASPTYDFKMQDDGGNTSIDYGGHEHDEWKWYVQTYDSGTVVAYDDGEVVGTDTSSSGATLDDTFSTYIDVMAKNDGTSPTPGEIAFIACWNRKLTKTEIEAMSNMTGRMVQQL